MSNYQSNIQETPKSRSGCRTVFIVLLVILILLLGLPFLLIRLLLPGQAQLDELKMSLENTTSYRITSESQRIVIPQEWIEHQLKDNLDLIISGTEELDFTGVSLTLDTNSLSLLAGVKAVNPSEKKPFIPEEINFTGSADFQVETDPEKNLTLTVENIRIGRLRIPLSTLLKIESIKHSFTGGIEGLSGFTGFDLKTNQLTLNLNDKLDSISPGTEFGDFLILPGRVELSLIPSQEMQKDLKDLAIILQPSLPELIRSIREEVQGYDEELLRDSQKRIERMAENSMNTTETRAKEKKGKTTQSYNPLTDTLAIMANYVHLQSLLTEKEREDLEWQIIHYFDDHPDAYEKASIIMEKYGERLENID